jgi:5-methylcytosine-specific restriction endonuclease McrA
MMLKGVIESNPSQHMHHIIPIAESEAMRMNPDNWLAVCIECHEAIEGDQMQGMQIKAWSDVHYINVLNEGLS